MGWGIGVRVLRGFPGGGGGRGVGRKEEGGRRKEEGGRRKEEGGRRREERGAGRGFERADQLKVSEDGL